MTADPGSLPDACAIAFKEWAGICRALADGRQSLIVRKGGIAEGPAGFRPEHDAFWLYPTRVHEAEQGLRDDPAAGPEAPAGFVALGALAAVEFVAFADREAILDRLAPFHIWTEETIRKRFHYRRPGLWVLGVRVFRRVEPHLIASTPEHAGCKTWVPLDEPLSTDGLVPALDDAEHVRRLERLRDALGAGPAGGTT